MRLAPPMRQASPISLPALAILCAMLPAGISLAEPAAPDTTKMSPIELMAWRAQRGNRQTEDETRPKLAELPKGVTLVTETPGNEKYPCWSPDGGSLYFSYGLGNDLRIFQLDLETGKREAMSDSLYVATEPDISPDGLYLAYSEKQPGLGRQIWIRRIADGATAKLTQNPGPDTEEFPRWHNSGMSLLYTHNIAHKPDSKAMSIQRDGESPLELMDDSAALVQPAMSYSGLRVSWVRRYGADSSLRIQDMRLKILQEDHSVAGLFISDGEWLPGDEKMIVTFLRKDAPRDGYDIGIMDLATDTIEPLLDIGPSDLDPRISPDGKRLAFVSNPSGQSDIYIYELP